MGFPQCAKRVRLKRGLKFWHDVESAQVLGAKKFPKVLVLMCCSLFLTLLVSPSARATNLDFSTLNWSWSDQANSSNNQSLSRTFRDVDYIKAGENLIPWLTFQTYDPSFNLAEVQLQLQSGSQWEDVLRPMSIMDYSMPDPNTGASPNPRTSYTGWMPFLENCSAYLWCNGLAHYRVMINGQLFKTFNITYVAKKTNLKISLSAPQELPYGKTFSLKISTSPKVKVVCTLIRNSMQMGTKSLAKGSGTYSLYALTKTKPTNSTEYMTLLVSCKGGKYSGAADKIISVFAPWIFMCEANISLLVPTWIYF